MGTASEGNGRISLVTDFNEKLKNPHFNPSFVTDFNGQPKAYNFKKSDFLEITNAYPETKQVIKTNVFTRRKL